MLQGSCDHIPIRLELLTCYAAGKEGQMSEVQQGARPKGAAEVCPCTLVQLCRPRVLDTAVLLEAVHGNKAVEWAFSLFSKRVKV